MELLHNQLVLLLYGIKPNITPNGVGYNMYLQDWCLVIPIWSDLYPVHTWNTVLFKPGRQSVYAPGSHHISHMLFGSSLANCLNIIELKSRMAKPRYQIE